jgi:RES domain-containing protein
MGEVAKAAEDNHIDVATQLQVPYTLHTIVVTDIDVLDLRSDLNRNLLGLRDEDLNGTWEACQPIGHAAWFLEFAGVLAPSATTPVGLTLALFEHRVSPAKVEIENSQTLTLELYQAYAAK